MDVVRKLRIRRGWSQRHLAEVAGISRATIQRIERGQIVPNPETTKAIAAALDVDARRILTAASLLACIVRTMKIGLELEATSAELAQLPPADKQILRELQKTRAAFLTTQDALTKAATGYSLPHEATAEEAASARLLSALQEMRHTGVKVNRLLARFT